MTTRALAQPIDPAWWSRLTDDDKAALLQAFRFRTGVDLSKAGGSPAAIWGQYEARANEWRRGRLERLGRRGAAVPPPAQRVPS
jgi:hypothetical protein